MNRRQAVMLCLLSVCLTGCASTQKQAAPLTKVKQNGIPGIGGFAAEAQQIARADYARIHAMLGGDGDRTPFSIEFRKSIWVPYEGPGGGYARGRNFRFAIGGRTLATYRVRVIELSAERFREHPERFTRTVRHEMAHLFQSYPKDTQRFWGEGIAEYVAHELEDGMPDCFCDAKHPSYDDGYGCAAAFLQYLRENYDTNNVAGLHHALLKGKKAEQFFAEITGCEFSDLWKDFGASHRYPLDARAVVTMREKVGASKSEDETYELLTAFLVTRLGGELTVSALHHVKTLADSGKIPAPRAREVEFHPDELEQSSDFPARRVIHFDSRKEKQRYDYHLAKNAAENDWSIDAIVVRNLRNGKVIRRLPVKQ